MPIKGHFIPCNKMGMVWGISRLHGLLWGGGGEIRGLEGRENALGVFLSENT